jgi:hypothetical protein
MKIAIQFPHSLILCLGVHEDEDCSSVKLNLTTVATSTYKMFSAFFRNFFEA